MSPNNDTVKNIDIIIGPVLALLGFFFTYWLDPLGYGSKQAATSIPAFLLSIIILLIDHGRIVAKETKKMSEISFSVYEAVKNNLHVTKFGSPEKAIEYINSRMSSLKEVNNTSFNLVGASEKAENKFYKTTIYDQFQNNIARYTSTRELIWQDIGDNLALNRFKKIYNEAKKNNINHRYYPKIICCEPQMNFILLTFHDDSKEVLFNWDFRGAGREPIVLLSRDQEIIQMFAIHFDHLLAQGSIPHDFVQQS